MELPTGDFLTVAEAAKELTVSVRRVQALARQSRLRGQLVLGRYLIERASVTAFKASARRAGRPKKNPPATS